MPRPRQEDLMSLRMLSWNVNGLRAVEKKGFMEWFREDRPDILCLQEIKALPEQLPAGLREIEGYRVLYHPAERRGYSGVATFSRTEPVNVWNGLGIGRFDIEGRTLITEHEDFLLYNVYFPNGKASDERLRYKMEFYDAFLEHVEARRNSGKHIVVCGDVNTAHREIDLARPRENEKVSGFLPEERAWIDRFLEHGYVDTFRKFTEEGGHYSWWDYKTRARERNVGWRIDYFYVNESLADRVRSAFILHRVPGSDHCPVGIELAI